MEGSINPLRHVAWETCYELRQRKLAHVSQPTLPVTYKEVVVPNAYRRDLIVGNEVIVELKTR